MDKEVQSKSRRLLTTCGRVLSYAAAFAWIAATYYVLFGGNVPQALGLIVLIRMAPSC